MRLAAILCVLSTSIAAQASVEDTTALMERARTAYDALEYEKVLPLVKEVLEREDVPVEQRMDAYLLTGSALAVVGDPVEAEKYFRFLLRGRPDFDLPPTTSPRILAVFRKVQVEERTIREEAASLRLANLKRELALKSDHPRGLQGGMPVFFRYRFRDPTGVIDSARVKYRRSGDVQYNSLPLKQDDEGVWRGSIPGEWTANEAGLVVEIVVVTATAANEPLLLIGSEDAPIALEVRPGTAVRRPPPLAPWVLYTGAGTTLALVAAGAGAGAWMLGVDAEYTRLLSESVGGPAADGAVTERELRPLGETLAFTANALFVAAGVVAIGTLVTIPFTNFDE